MAASKKHFLNSDALAGICMVCLGALVWYSLTRDEGYFSPKSPTADGPRGKAPVPYVPGAQDTGRTLDDPSQPASVSQAVRLYTQGHERELAGDSKGALEFFQKASKLDPVRKFYWASQGSAAMMGNHYDIAYPAFMQAYKLDCFDTFNMTNLGFICQSMRKEDEARRFYLMTLAIQPDSQTAWDELYNGSHVYPWLEYSDEIHKAALTPANSDNNNLIYKLNQKALDQNPNDYYYIINRALMNLRFMRLETVQADVDRALKIDPHGAAALLAQAQLYNYSGQFDKAVKAYKDCIAVSPQPVAYAELGAIQMQTGKFDQALNSYQKATELGNDKPSWVATLNKLVEIKRKSQSDAEHARTGNGKPTGVAG